MEIRGRQIELQTKASGDKQQAAAGRPRRKMVASKTRVRHGTSTLGHKLANHVSTTTVVDDERTGDVQTETCVKNYDNDDDDDAVCNEQSCTEDTSACTAQATNTDTAVNNNRTYSYTIY